LGGLARDTYTRLVRSRWTTSKDRHNDEPTPGQLIVANNSVAIVPGLALAAESGEHGPGHHWTIQNFARRIEAFALLREDGHARVNYLDDVIGSDCE
jgi:hypothetical protein